MTIVNFTGQAPVKSATPFHIRENLTGRAGLIGFFWLGLSAIFSWRVSSPKYFRGLPHIKQEQTVLFFAR